MCSMFQSFQRNSINLLCKKYPGSSRQRPPGIGVLRSPSCQRPRFTMRVFGKTEQPAPLVTVAREFLSSARRVGGRIFDYTSWGIIRIRRPAQTKGPKAHARERFGHAADHRPALRRGGCARARRPAWGARYFQELLALARSHLSARIRGREDEDDVLQSMYNSFCLCQRRGDFNLANRDELSKLLVQITLRAALIRRFAAPSPNGRRISPLPPGEGGRRPGEGRASRSAAPRAE